MARIETDVIVDQILETYRGGSPSNIPFSLLLSTSRNFSERIGQEGEYFRAEISKSDGSKVVQLAVKRANRKPSSQEGTEVDRVFTLNHLEPSNNYEEVLQFVHNEILLLTKFRHRNIIRLVGYSINQKRRGDIHSELCLCYELADRGSLDEYLIDEIKARQLDWKLRIKIASEIACALSCFHNGGGAGGDKAYHRDVKSTNIGLAGVDYTAKLINCNLAKLLPEKQNSVFSMDKRRFGTPGYMCSKYFEDGIYDAKSEIYSFGIVLGELLSGFKQGHNGEIPLDRDAIIEDGLEADPRAGVWPAECSRRMLELCRSCLAPKKRRIDSMSAVFRILRELKREFFPEVFEEGSGSPRRCSNREEVEALRRELESLQVQVQGSHKSDVDDAEAKDCCAKENKKEKEKLVLKSCCICCGDPEVAISSGVECFPVPTTPNVTRYAAGGGSGESSDDALHLYRHFYCDDCFSNSISHQTSPTEYEHFKDAGCKIVCFYCLPRTTPFSERDIALHASEEMFVKYRVTTDNLREADLEEKITEKITRKVIGEQMGDEGRELRVFKHRTQIESMLNIACPNIECGVTISLDFEACFAVTCMTCR